MNDIYQKKYSFRELLELIIGYVKAQYWFFLPLVVIYLIVFFICGISILNFVYDSSVMTIAKNAEMVAFIQDVNSSGTQIFVLFQLIIKIIGVVIVPLLLMLFTLAILHNFVAIMIFISQDLYVRKANLDIRKMLFHCLKRSVSIILTDLLLWLYYSLFFVVFIAIIIAGQFFVTLGWINRLVLPWSFFIGIFAIDWCYIYQAVYKYPLNGHNAMRYSSLLIKDSFKDTVIWICTSGSLYLLCAFGFITILLNSETRNLPVNTAICLTVFLLYNFLTKLYSNFLFLNQDYVAREKKLATELQPDLISKNIAPIKSGENTKVMVINHRRSIRPRAAGSIMRHRYRPPEISEEKPKKSKKSKSKKTSNKKP